MLRRIEAILKRHLHDAVKEYERGVEMTVVSPFEILWTMPSFAERRALARELVETIKGTDVSKLRFIPSQAEAEKFIRSIIPNSLIHQYEYDVVWHARQLRQWLWFCEADRATKGRLMTERVLFQRMLCEAEGKEGEAQEK